MKRRVTHKREPHVDHELRSVCYVKVTRETVFTDAYEIPTCNACLHHLSNGDYGDGYRSEYPEFDYVIDCVTRGSEL